MCFCSGLGERLSKPLETVMLHQSTRWTYRCSSSYPSGCIVEDIASCDGSFGSISVSCTRVTVPCENNKNEENTPSNSTKPLFFFEGNITGLIRERLNLGAGSVRKQTS
jgi:hypothetical protein